MSGIALQTADLKWLVPMIIGSIALLAYIYAFMRNPNLGWTSIAIPFLAVVLIGASLFSKFSFTKEGITIETTLNESTKALTDLQTATKANSVAIGELTTRLNQLATVTQKVDATQPTGSQHAAEIGQITQATQKIQAILKANEATLNRVNESTTRLKMQLQNVQ